MTITELLEALHARDVRLQVRGDKLVVDAPENALDDALRAALKHSRSELIALLGAGGAPRPLLQRRPRSELARFPLSVAQHAFFLLDRVNPGSRAFNIFALREIRGELGVVRLGRALAAVVAAHDVLRTRFELHGEQAWQVVSATATASLQLADLSGLDAHTAETVASRLCDRRAAPRFDLEQGPLFRLRLVRFARDRHTLVLALHHIIADDRTIDLFFRALVRAYLDEPPVQAPAALPEYPDFAQWERDLLEAGAFDATIDYWKARLTRLPALLGASRSAGPLAESGCASVHRRFDRTSAARIAALSAQWQTSRFALLLSAYQLLWALRSGHTDIPIIVPVSNRLLPQTQDMFGVFVNAVVMRTDLDSCTRIDQLVRSNAEVSQSALEHRQVSLEAMDGILRKRGRRDDNLDALARIGFNYLSSAGDDAAYRIGHLDIVVRSTDRTESVFQAMLVVQERDEVLQVKLEYRDDLWSAGQAQVFLDQYAHIVETICARPQAELAEIDGVPTAFWRDAAAQRLTPAWRTFLARRSGAEAAGAPCICQRLRGRAPPSDIEPHIEAGLAAAAAQLPDYRRADGIDGADWIYRLAAPGGQDTDAHSGAALRRPVSWRRRGDERRSQAIAAAARELAQDGAVVGCLLLPAGREPVQDAVLVMSALPEDAAWQRWLQVFLRVCPWLEVAAGEDGFGAEAERAPMSVADDAYRCSRLALDAALVAATDRYGAYHGVATDALVAALAALALLQSFDDGGEGERELVMWPWPSLRSAGPLRFSPPRAGESVPEWLVRAAPLMLDTLGRPRSHGIAPEALLIWHGDDVPADGQHWPALDRELHLGLRRRGGEIELHASLAHDLAGQRHFLPRVAAALRQCVEGGAAAADLHFFSSDDERAMTALNAAAPRTLPHPAALVLDLIAAQVQRSPDAVAVIAGDTCLSYAQLGAASRAYADWIGALCGGRPTLVGVCLQRDAALPALLLGLWQAGCAFVPLDPAAPAERIARMLRDCGAGCIVASGDLHRQFAEAALPLHRLPALSASGAGPALCSAPAADPLGLAYVMFTSGSSGVPSGVRVHHAALSNLLQSFLIEPGVSAADCLLATTSLSFDIALLELLLPLAAGARLCIAQRTAATDPGEIIALLQQHRATICQATPSTWRLLLRCGWQGGPPLRLLCGGEALDGELAGALLARCAELWNVYGPTETTIWSTLVRLRSAQRARCIGHPVAKTQLRVCDARGRPVAVGVAGELWIGGAGVALGYCGDAGARAAKFVQTQDAGGVQRWYRSGDWVVLDRYGELMFLGRNDRQIKRRGVRIELDEIEAALNALDGVDESAVWLQRDDAGEELIAAVAADGLDAGAVRQRLLLRLPANLLPDRISVARQLPRLVSGKLDRQRIAAQAKAVQIAPPPGGKRLEDTIAQIWTQLLGHADFRESDNFFDVGGHSLLLISAHQQIGAAVAMEFAPIELFNHPSIAALAAFLRRQTPPASVAATAAVPTPIAGDAPIAIVGMAGRVPGAANLAQFWDNLCAGRESIRDLQAADLLAQGVPAALLRDPRYIRRASTLAGIEDFDADFFGLSAREAELLDPQHRLLLELCYEALEDAGHGVPASAGRVGLYAGVGISAYLIYNLWPKRNEILATQSPLELLYANDKDYAVTRVAYVLNLRGPAVSVGTACSTGLVAVHQACRSLRDGDCDLALAAAVKVAVPQETGYPFTPGGIFSADGRCRPFDAAAGGTVFGSGGGCVVLKRLDAAERDGDEIYAIVAGSAVNNDGRAKVGFTAPSVAGQADVIGAALQRAGVSAQNVGYVEAHGTGTQLGDPIEAAALQQVFARAELPSTPCLVGSVKSNIGHLDTAAGIVGLVKAALSLHHGRIPPSLHFSVLNPRIGWDARRFRVAQSAQPWSAAAGARIAGVSSFGIGGSNAHVVLRDSPRMAVLPAAETGTELIVLSAASEAALQQRRQALAAALDARRDTPLADIAYTLQSGRPALRWRTALAVRSLVELRSQLDTADFADSAAGRGRLIFVFPGGEWHPTAPASALYEEWPAYRDAFDACAALLAPLVGLDSAALLAGADSTYPAATRHDHLQPARFCAQYSFARLLITIGLQPSALLGYGLGEIAAACVAGVFGLDDALRLVVARGAVLHAAVPGAMMSVFAPAADVDARLPAALSVAAYDGDGETVVTGSTADVAAFARGLAAAGIDSRRLPVERAFQSPCMGAALEQLARTMSLQAPQIPLLSGVSGGWQDSEFANPDYWCRQACAPLRFRQAVAALQLAPGDVVIELDTEAALTQRWPGRFTAPAGDRRAAPRERFLALVGHAWQRGWDLDWAALQHGRRLCRVHLPAYAFERRRFWIERTAAAAGAADVSAEPGRQSVQHWLYQPAWTRRRLAAADADAVSEGLWMLFVSDAETAIERCLVALLRERGGTVVVIKKIPAVDAVLAAVTLVVDSDDPAHLLPICAGLRHSVRGTCRVLLGWGLDAPDAPSGLAAWLNVLAHTAAACAGGAQDSGRFLVLSAAADPAAPGLAAASVAAVGAAVRVLGREHPGLLCRQLSVDDAFVQADGDATEQLLAELLDRADDSVVSIRHGQRRVAAYCRYLAGPPREPLRPRQVCVITGGLGGIGALLAEHLIEQHHCRIALLGRSVLADGANGEKLRRYRQLCERQPGLLYLRADVADPHALSAAMARIEDELGPVALVVHAAGLADGRLAQLHDAPSIATVLAAKVHGAQALLELAARRAIGRVVLCSSITAVSGDVGQYAYAAANAVLDAIAEIAVARGLDWSSINWDTWRDVGMAAESAATGAAAEQLARRRARGLDNAEGMALFDRLLGDASERVIVSTVDLEPRLRAGSGVQHRATPVAARAVYPRPALGHPAIAAHSDTERRLLQLWGDALRLEGIGVTDNYFDLGGTSLQALQLVDAIESAVGLRVAPGVLLEHASVRELAMYLEDRGGGEDDDGLLVALASGHRRDQQELYLVHPIGGQVYLYRELAAALADDLRIGGVRAPDEDEAASVAELAQRYLAELDRVQAAPYVLGGASFGGMVAYEMACRLAEVGRAPALLVLMDTPDAADVAGRYSDDAELLRYLAEQMPEFAWLRKPVAQSQPAALSLLLQRGTDSELARHLRRLRQHMQAMQDYRAGAYVHPLLYIKASRRRAGIDPPAPETAWQQRAAQFTLASVDADHVSMHQAPGVTAVAACIRAALAAAQPRPARTVVAQGRRNG